MKGVIFKAVLIYAVALALVFLADYAHALEYDVSWPRSTKKGHQMLEITIGDCVTVTFVDNNKMEEFAKDQEGLRRVLRVAMQRYKDGCPSAVSETRD